MKITKGSTDQLLKKIDQESKSLDMKVSEALFMFDEELRNISLCPPDCSLRYWIKILADSFHENMKKEMA